MRGRERHEGRKEGGRGARDRGKGEGGDQVINRNSFQRKDRGESSADKDPLKAGGCEAKTPASQEMSQEILTWQ